MYQIGVHEKEIAKLQLLIVQKDKMIEDLQEFPNKKELSRNVDAFLNGETMEESIKRILKDDYDDVMTFKGTDVSMVLQQMAGK
jgi:hypothetical protein